MPDSKPVVGIDLGGTNVQIGVVGDGKKVLGRAKRKSKPEEGRDAVIGRIVEGVEEACKEAKIKVSEIAGVGIGAPGAIDPDTGTVIEAVNLRWDNVPLADLLGKKLNKPVFVDNDVNVAVYGENKLGAGENARDLLGGKYGDECPSGCNEQRMKSSGRDEFCVHAKRWGGKVQGWTGGTKAMTCPSGFTWPWAGTRGQSRRSP